MRVTDPPDISAEPADKAEQGVEPGMAEAAQPEQTEGPDTRPRRRRWRERQSVRALRRETMEALPAWHAWDRRENDETRLPDGERVHVGGIVLAEAFTPSTVSALRKAIEDMSLSRETREDWLERLAKGRSAAGAGGWPSTGIIRDKNWTAPAPPLTGSQPSCEPTQKESATSFGRPTMPRSPPSTRPATNSAPAPSTSRPN